MSSISKVYSYAFRGITVSIDEDPRRMSSASASTSSSPVRKHQREKSIGSKPNSVSSSPGKKQLKESASGFLPKSSQGEGKRTMRRVSDLFAETMGEFDTFSLGHGGSDLSF